MIIAAEIAPAGSSFQNNAPAISAETMVKIKSENKRYEEKNIDFQPFDRFVFDLFYCYFFQWVRYLSKVVNYPGEKNSNR